MEMPRGKWGIAVVTALVCVAADAGAAPLTLAEALRLADEAARANRMATLEANRAAWQRAAAWSQVGPKLQLSYDYQWWNEAITFDLDLPPEFRQYFPQGTTGGVVRPRETYTFGVTVVQPLSNLYQVFLGARLAGLQVDMARLQEGFQRRRTRMQVVEAFHAVLEAHKRVESLDAALRTAQAHLEQVERFHEQGLLKRDDVLRVQVRVAQVEQGLTLARTGADVACGQLDLLIGRSPSVPCDLAEEEEAPGPMPDDPEVCVAEALRARQDVAQARLAVDVARTARLLKAGDWLPQVAGIFNYSRTRATQFSHPEAWFLGVSLTWTPWEWGRTYFEFRGASDQVEAAVQTALQVEDLVRLEVRSRWLEARAARDNLDRSAVAVEQARENLRIQMDRARQNLTTTADVLDAEALVVQAEADRFAALYGYRVALRRLADAMGRSP